MGQTKTGQNKAGTSFHLETGPYVWELVEEKSSKDRNKEKLKAAVRNFKFPLI